jgi:hypothetical protein
MLKGIEREREKAGKRRNRKKKIKKIKKKCATINFHTVTN